MPEALLEEASVEKALLKHGFKFFPARAPKAGRAGGQGGGEPGVPEGVVDHQAVVPEVPQGGVPHDFVVGENLVGRKHGIGKSVADAYARHAGLVGEAFGDGRPGVAPVPSRGEAASGKAGQAGGLLEGSSAATILLTCSAPGPRRGEPGAVIGEDVGDGNQEEITVGVLDFKLVRAVEAPRSSEAVGIWPPRKGAGVLPCLVIVLALRIGSLSTGGLPIYRYSIVGDKRGVQRGRAVFARFFSFFIGPFVVFPHFCGKFNLVNKRFSQALWIQVEDGRHGLGEKFLFPPCFSHSGKRNCSFCWDPSGRPPSRRFPGLWRHPCLRI